MNRLKLKFEKAVGEFLTLEFGFAQDTSEKEEKKKKEEVRRKLNLTCLFKKPQQFAINILHKFLQCPPTQISHKMT